MSILAVQGSHRPATSRASAGDSGNVSGASRTGRLAGRRRERPHTCFVEKGEFTVIPTTMGRRDLAGSFDEFRICG